MREVNKEILKWISSGEMEKDILKFFGEEVETLSLWGGEPTVNLIPFADRLKEIKKTLPKFNKISFSTNISTKSLSENIIYLMEKSNEIFLEDAEFSLDIQFSLDGPSDFNDCARIGSYSNEIVENIDTVLKEANKLEMKNNIFFSAKATHSKENIKRLSEYSELFSYFSFFDKAYEKWSESFDRYPNRAHTITLVYPGKYTKEDGENYLRLLKNLEKIKKIKWKKINSFENQLEERVFQAFITIDRKNFRPFKGEFFSSFNCSAGDGFLGLSYDGKLHICQGSFFLDEGAIEEIESKKLSTVFEESLGYSFKNYYKYIKNIAVVEGEDRLSYLRFLSGLEKFRQGVNLRFQYAKIMIPLLVASGDILDKYLQEKEADILSLIFTIGSFSCPSANIWEFGSYWVQELSVMKLLGNGVLDFILKGE